MEVRISPTKSAHSVLSRAILTTNMSYYVPSPGSHYLEPMPYPPLGGGYAPSYNPMPGYGGYGYDTGYPTPGYQSGYYGYDDGYYGGGSHHGRRRRHSYSGRHHHHHYRGPRVYYKYRTVSDRIMGLLGMPQAHLHRL